MPANLTAMARKVVFVDHGAAFGGSIVVLAHLIRYMDRRQYEPVLITPMPEDVLRSLFAPQVPIRRITFKHDYRARERFIARFRRFGPIAHRFGVYLFTLVSLKSTFGYRLRFWRVLRGERPQLVHVNNNAFHAAEVCAVMGVPFIWHFHGLNPDHKLSGWRRWVLRKALRFVSISEYTASLAGAYRGPGFQPIDVIPNPAPKQLDLESEELLELRRRWGIAPQATVIGIFGRLVSWKGQLEFLQAFSKVQDEFPDAVALVVGDASDLGQQYEAQLRASVNDDLRGRVVFTGYIADVFPLYQTCDIVVHASIEPEPFGLVIVEAMSAGSAVIASALGAGPELVADGDTGLVVDPRHPEQLALALRRLLGDRELRARLARRGQDYALEMFDPEHYARRMEELYQQSLAGPAGSQRDVPGS
jgi:glycosyltransferase involved in cell wall biosynthesis